MEILVQIIIATILVSIISFSGALLFIAKEKKIKKFMILIVALAAGSLLGTSFFHLIPEAIEMSEDIHLEEESEHLDEHTHEEGHNHGELSISYFILFGILIFFILEKFIFWHHHHEIGCEHHSMSTLSLVGDGVHNFMDGILIAAAFMTDTSLGIVTTIAIMLHEIPQEIGDLAILLHSGFSKMKALVWNFISALFSVLGALITYFTLGSAEQILPYVIALTAGTFIYLSLADIVPELNKKHKISQFSLTCFFLLGIVLMFIMTRFLSH